MIELSNINPVVWHAAAAFTGGLGAYLIRINFFNAPGETKGKLWHGVVYAVFSALGGLFLLNPPTTGNAFAAGLIGVAAMTNYTRQNNEGPSKAILKKRKLAPQEIKASYQDEV